MTTDGTWANSQGSFSYQWQACSSGGCTNISGATNPTYTVESSDVGGTVAVVVTAHNAVGSTPATSAQTDTVTAPTSSGLYSLPADRSFAWNPGLDAVGGIPGRTAVYQAVLSPSGGDDTATIQSALDSCPTNRVVQFTAGVFHITGQGLSIEHSDCTLRGADQGRGTGPSGWRRAARAGRILSSLRGRTIRL